MRKLKKPELLVLAGSKEEISIYLQAGADAVLIGENQFGLRLPGEILSHELQDVVKSIHQANKKVYIAVNQLYTNDRIPSLSKYLELLESLKVDAILFGDPAVLMLYQELGLTMDLHWSADMTSTNYATANYWSKRGAKKVVLARELNLEEIEEFANNSLIPIEVQVHGTMPIYHSKRHLVDSYLGIQPRDQEIDTGITAGLFLKEAERPNEQFPIYENEQGTYIFSSDDLCLVEVLDELLASPIGTLRIETMLKSVSYNERVIQIYRAAIDSWYENPKEYTCKSQWLEDIQKIQDPQRELTFGFLFKEQVY